MLAEESFKLWLNDLFQNHKLNNDKKKQFYFLTFENYISHTEHAGIIIYEDWWIRKPNVVKSKIKSILQISNRIFARQSEVKKINKTEADLFLNKNHIYDSTNSKIKYGLFYKDDLLGVATFAGQRQFRKGRSVELLRYCNKSNYITIGGLDKLLKAYIKEYQPDTMMTYVDLDWGNGNAFIKLGFEPKETKDTMLFYTDIKSGLRTPEKYFNDFENIKNYVKVKNMGSLKMIKTL